mmetsp:Transcript_40701/g.85509  ORF Transcript_40701/g.85509 Transcript_40701/m.85509 type:complete len:121 (+) Transcript_40701:69-431(+)
MDKVAAQELLLELLKHLPEGLWWLLIEKYSAENGIAKAFGRPIAEINALLHNAGVVSVGEKTNSREWEELCRSENISEVSDPICYRSSDSLSRVLSVLPNCSGTKGQTYPCSSTTSDSAG